MIKYKKIELVTFTNDSDLIAIKVQRLVDDIWETHKFVDPHQARDFYNQIIDSWDPEKQRRATNLAFLIAKRYYQDLYGWNDEQFQIFWDNPEKNSFVEYKQQYIENAQYALYLVETGAV